MGDGVGGFEFIEYYSGHLCYQAKQVKAWNYFSYSHLLLCHHSVHGILMFSKATVMSYRNREIVSMMVK